MHFTENNYIIIAKEVVTREKNLSSDNAGCFLIEVHFLCISQSFNYLFKFWILQAVVPDIA